MILLAVRRSSALLAAGVLVLLPAAGARAATPKVADITAVTGEARVTRAATQEVEDAEEDLDVFEGDRIDTLAASKVTISFVDHHLLRLGEKTTMVVKTVKADPASGSFLGRVRLLTGRLFASFGRATGRRKTGFVVETRSAVAAVKGTTFGVEEADEGSTVSVEEGVVSTAPVDEQGREGQAVDVPGGKETSVDAKSRKVGDLRGFITDERRKWMKDELTGLKGYAGRFREMQRNGDLDKLRELRGLARSGRLASAGPKLARFMATHPDLKRQILEHAERHKRNLLRRGQGMVQRAPAKAAEDAGAKAEQAKQAGEQKAEKAKDEGEQKVEKGLNRLNDWRKKLP